ncbi:hypothetical protein [Amycolatopsis sp. lyj-346]|uniref:hypothetical protein n=1 Tax=Amycolatopsis sp. lyj-346 TaxID=2789289 RepID=UPI003979D6CF
MDSTIGTGQVTVGSIGFGPVVHTVGGMGGSSRVRVAVLLVFVERLRRALGTLGSGAPG